MERIIKVIGEEEEKIRKRLLEEESRIREVIKKEFMIISPTITGFFFAPPYKENDLGIFISSDMCILLNEELINGDYSITKNVFIHEYSHSVDYTLRGYSLHDSFFKEICKKLGIEDGFEKANVASKIVKKESVKQKIEKLISLSSSPFKEESLSALKKAKELMEKEGIKEWEEKKKKEEKIYFVDLTSNKRIVSHKYYTARIAALLSNTLLVKINNKPVKTLRLYGGVEECEMGLYFFDYLLSSLKEEVKIEKKNGKEINKDSFMYGAFFSIEKKLNSNNKSLELINKERLRIIKEYQFKEGYVKRTTSHIIRKNNGYEEGQIFGLRLDVSKIKKGKLLN